MKTRLRTLACAFLLLSLVLMGVGGCSQTAVAPSVAPNFILKDISGRTVALEDYNGKIIVVDFWATWCPPCRRSIPELIRLQDTYRDEGVVILGVSVDDPAKADDRYLRSFKEKYRMNYVVLRGNNDVLNDYFGNERLGIPTLFVINREGKIVERHNGFVPGAVELTVRNLL